MYQNNDEILSCPECEQEVKTYQRFCQNCGAFLGTDAEQISIFDHGNMQTAFFFYAAYLLVCLIVKYTGWFYSYDRLFWVEIFLALLTLFMVRKNWAYMKPALRFNNFNIPVLITVIAVAIVFSSVVNVSITQLNISIFGKDENLFDAYRMYEAPAFVMIYSIAIMPAIFEELTFRGVIYNYLNTVLDERLVVIVTGFIFAAIHLNFFALIWLIPFGIFIGSLRKRYNTIWYGVIFHFTFNLTACLFDLYRVGKL